MITITDAAARALLSLLEEKGEPGKALRLFVEKGGCAGLSYGMTLDEPAPADTVAEHSGARVVVDATSLEHLRDVTLDYTDELAGAGFRIINPHAVRSCGCGTSFEPESEAGATAHTH